VRAFQPLYVGFLEAGSLLIEPRWVGDEPVSSSFDRGWFKGIHSELERFVDDGLLTEAEAAERVIGRVLERAAENLSKQVLAHSSGVSDADHEQWPLAFVPVTGRSRLHNRGDEMLPSGYGETEHWELPDGFESVLPKPISEGERTPLRSGPTPSPKPDPLPAASTTPLNGVSKSFEIGDRVFDRTQNRSGPGSGNTLVVVWTPEEAAADYEIESQGRTVAEVNPRFNRRSSVAEAVYVNDLPEHVDASDSEQVAECYQRGDLESEGVSVYAFPEGRLGAVNDDGETVKQVS